MRERGHRRRGKGKGPTGGEGRGRGYQGREKGKGPPGKRGGEGGIGEKESNNGEWKDSERGAIGGRKGNAVSREGRK